MQSKKSRLYPENVIVKYEKYFFIRVDKGLTDADVAKLAQVEASMIARWHKGNITPSVKTLHKIATALGCKVSDFLEVLPEVI